MAGSLRRVLHACVTTARRGWSAVWSARRFSAVRRAASAEEKANDLAVQRTGEVVLAEAVELAEIEQQVMAEHQNAAETAKPVSPPRRPPPPVDGT
jgi:hypothetical protein